jgi:hypothetical protein
VRSRAHSASRGSHGRAGAKGSRGGGEAARARRGQGSDCAAGGALSRGRAQRASTSKEHDLGRNSNQHAAAIASTSADSRAQVAETWSSAINDSRKRCGLAPLDAATLTREFADVDLRPSRTKKAAAAPGREPGCGRRDDRAPHFAERVLALKSSADRGGSRLAAGRRADALGPRGRGGPPV